MSTGAKVGATHTPGPWNADPNDLLNGDEIAIRSDEYPEAVVACVWPWGDDEHGAREREANARLIAGAPDLLAALKDLVTAAEREFDTRRCAEGSLRRLNAARAAIARAEGLDREGTDGRMAPW